MLYSKSLLHIEKNGKSYDFLADPQSDIYDVKNSLVEMLCYVQTVIDQAEKQRVEAEKVAQEKPLDQVPDTEQTL